MEPPPENRMRVAILAAGESRRMGKPKLCLPWSGTTILGHILDQWRTIGVDGLLVIHAPDADNPVIRELNHLGVPPEQRAATIAMERGMMGSVVTAAQWAGQSPSPSHLIIALGDQPHLRPATLRTLVEICRTREKSIIRIVFQGKPGHPLALPAHLLPELSQTSCATLRDFISFHSKDLFDLTSDDSGVLLDLDTPDDYAQATTRAKSVVTPSQTL